MTKAAKIVKLLKTGKTVREVADIVGVLPEYVRTVRQRASGNRAPLNKWESKVKEASCIDTARMEGQIAYERAKHENRPVWERHTAYTRAYYAARRRTGRQALRMQALLAPVEA
jgi:hypothetical protein